MTKTTTPTAGQSVSKAKPSQERLHLRGSSPGHPYSHIAGRRPAFPDGRCRLPFAPGFGLLVHFDDEGQRVREGGQSMVEQRNALAAYVAHQPVESTLHAAAGLQLSDLGATPRAGED